MKPFVLVYAHDGIFSGVKQESSQLAVRTKDQEGNDLFEELVFDEAYMEKFRELFLDAQAEVLPVLSAYLKNPPPSPPNFFELRDLTDDRDFEILLMLPDDFITALLKVIDIKINQFLIACILFRWLETKLPSAALLYKERADTLLHDIKSLLNRKVTPDRIRHQLF